MHPLDYLLNTTHNYYLLPPFLNQSLLSVPGRMPEPEPSLPVVRRAEEALIRQVVVAFRAAAPVRRVEALHRHQQVQGVDRPDAPGLPARALVAPHEARLDARGQRPALGHAVDVLHAGRLLRERGHHPERDEVRAGRHGPPDVEGLVFPVVEGPDLAEADGVWADARDDRVEDGGLLDIVAGGVRDLLWWWVVLVS